MAKLYSAEDIILQVFYKGFFRFEGARVPHRLCIKGLHPPRKGVTGATRVPPNKRPTQQETHPNPPCLGRELLLLRIDIIAAEDVFAPSLLRERLRVGELRSGMGWGGSLNSLENFQLSIIGSYAKHHRKREIL